MREGEGGEGVLSTPVKMDTVIIAKAVLRLHSRPAPLSKVSDPYIQLLILVWGVG